MSDAAFQALYELVCEYFEVTSQSAVARVLNRHQPQVHNWLQRGPTKATWKALLRRLIQEARREVVWDILEFAPVDPVRSGNRWQISAGASRRKELRDVLAGRIGLYMFYDSAGHILYVGKTGRDLWDEIRQRLGASYNRHTYFPNRSSNAQVGKFTRYLSAYEVGDKYAAHNLEALLLRAIPNDQANTNIGHFKWTPRS